MNEHKKIKVAILGSFPLYPYRAKVNFWNNRKSLVTSWNYNLARALARNINLEVHFFCNASLWRTKIYNDEGLIIHFVGHPPKLSIINRITFLQFSKFQYHKMLKKLKPDIVHGIGTDHEYAYIAVTSGFPNIITVHGVMKQIVRKLGYSLVSIQQFYALFEEIAVKKANFLISINPYVLEQFQTFKGKCFEIENSISPSFFNMVSSESYDLCFVGMYNEGKRLHNVLKALVSLKQIYCNIKLRIIGNSRDLVYEKFIKNFIIDNTLIDNIEFAGQLEQEEAAIELSKSKMLIVPSIQETAPMIIAEAMAIGKPVIATNVGGIKYMIKDGETGFIVTPDDINELTEKIKILLEDDELRFQMGNNAKRIALKTYHSDIIAKKTTDAYLNVIESITKSI